MGLVVGRVERRRMGKSRKRRFAGRRTNVRRGGRGSSKKVNTFVIVAISINFFIQLIVVTNVNIIKELVFSGRGGSEGSNENLSSNSGSSRRHSSSRNSETEQDGGRADRDHTVPTL